MVLKVTDHPDMTKHIPSSADSRRTSCQLLAKEWTLYTGKLPLRDLPRNSVVLKVTDHPDMTSAVYFGRKASLLLGIVQIKINNNRSTSLERSVIYGEGAYTGISSMTISFCSGSKHLVV